MERVMRELADGQHGLVSREQLRQHGIGRQAVARRLQSRLWAAVTPRVLRLAGTPETAEQRAMAAVLDAGGRTVLSHRSAAALWGLPGFDLDELEVSRPRKGPNRESAVATVHHPRYLPPHHCALRGCIPVTTLVRTVFDLAGAEHPGRTEGALHAALRAGLRWATLTEHLEEVGSRGRPGIELMRELIAAHRGLPVLGSGLEGRFLRIIKGAGLPEPRRQVDLGAHNWIGRVDFLYDDVRLVIEVNGSWAHTTSIDMERDQRRMAGLVGAGYAVLPLPERLIRERPEEVVRLVRLARRRAA